MRRMDVQEIIRLLLLPPEAGGRAPTQAELAADLGVGQSTVSKWKKGTHLPDFHQSQKLHAFAVARGILNSSVSTLAVKRTVAIVGLVGLGEAIDWFPPGEEMSLELVELPFAVPEGCFALESRGNSQYPRVKDGEIVVARSNGHTVDDLLGQEAVVRLRDGTYLLKTLKRGYQAKRYNLESHNRETMENMEVEWAAEVWAIIPSKRWVRSQ